MILKADCRHFPGSRPCRFNKESGQTCPDCQHYQPKGKRILITKLDALGDVLRTTALLHGIKTKYPDSYIVWITKSGAIELFKNNSLVDELWIAETDAQARIQAEEFDLVINTDADKWTAALAASAKTKARLGLTLDKNGSVIPANPEAAEWLEMGAFDALKKANAKSYQQIIFEMCLLKYQHEKPILNLTAAERDWAKGFLQQQGYDSTRKLIGLNLGGGGRWKNKRWTEEHILSFGKMISMSKDMQLLVIGGPWERELIARLQIQLKDRVIYSGTDKTIRELAALIAECHSLVTGDTLSLHIATALNTHVIALFGPTSASEIDLYNNGIKITPDLGCCCCYLLNCDKTPNCMALITPTVVLEGILAQSARPQKRSDA